MDTKKPAAAAPAKSAPAKSAAPVVSPQTQDMLRRLLAGAMKIMYSSPQGTQSIVEMVKKAPDPAAGIVAAAMLVVKQVADASKGAPVPMLVRLCGAVAALIAEICVAAKVVKDEPTLMPRVYQLLRRAATAKPQAAPAAKPAAAAPPAAAQPQPGIIAGAQQQPAPQVA